MKTKEKIREIIIEMTDVDEAAEQLYKLCETERIRSVGSYAQFNNNWQYEYQRLRKHFDQEKRWYMEQANKEISELKQKYQSMKSKFCDHDMIIMSQEKEIAELHKQNNSLRNVLNEDDKQSLVELETALATRERQVIERDKEISELKQKLNKQDAELGECAYIIGKEPLNVIRELKQKLSHYEDMMSDADQYVGGTD